MKGNKISMNKAELIKAINKNTGIKQDDVAVVLNNFKEVIKETVSNGDSVSISGFITFETKHINAKKGISRLGKEAKEWTSPERDVIKATLSKKYRDI